jgi:hypothetical protein
MGSATSHFDLWLQHAQERAGELELRNALGEVARLASEAHGARLWFAEVLGRRWSYIVGERPEQPAVSVQRVPLGRGIGVVSDTWGSLSGDEVARLIDFLGRLVATKGSP